MFDLRHTKIKTFQMFLMFSESMSCLEGRWVEYSHTVRRAFHFAGWNNWRIQEDLPAGMQKKSWDKFHVISVWHGCHIWWENSTLKRGVEVRSLSKLNKLFSQPNTTYSTVIQNKRSRLTRQLWQAHHFPPHQKSSPYFTRGSSPLIARLCIQTDKLSRTHKSSIIVPCDICVPHTAVVFLVYWDLDLPQVDSCSPEFIILPD